MPRRTLLWNGGLVTSRDAATLQSNDMTGELSLADNAEYLPDDPGIWPIAGSSAFNSTSVGGPMLCAGFFEFEPGISKIIALVGSAYKIATMGTTGSFSDLVTGLAGTATQFDQASLGNQHILTNGVDRNRVVSSDGTTTPQGMLQNTTPPTISRDAGVGAGFTLTTGSTIKYWVELRVKSGSTILRRNAAPASTVATLTGDGTLDKPVITQPTVPDTDATHWALFGTATNGVYPTGAEIAEVAIGVISIEDTRTGSNPLFPAGATYPVVAVELLGLVTTVPKYGQPPISSTADVFEGSIVQNDVVNDSHVRFTFPDEIHATPSLNVINIRTKWKDRVVWIRTLGRAVMVGMEHGLWRIDTLPLPEDAGFEPDRVKTEIDGAHGSVSPLAVASFSFGQGSLLAYVSRHGILVTDGNGWDILTGDLDWEATVNVNALSSAVLVNNVRKYRLELYASAPDGVRKTHFFCYHPSHIKPGVRAKVTGPNDIAALGAFVGHIEGDGSDFYTFTARSDGKLYREGVGNLTAGTFRVRSGSLYLYGIGGEASFNRGWFHHGAGATGQQATIRIVMEAEGEVSTEATDVISLQRREASFMGHQGLADSFQFGIEMASGGQRVRHDFAAIDWRPAGEEQSK
jgi:hypothetical protein